MTPFFKIKFYFLGLKAFFARCFKEKSFFSLLAIAAAVN